MNRTLSSDDSRFLAYSRGMAILVIVFGHVGGFWFLPPYSEFLYVFVPVFFFLSGAVSYFSYLRSKTTAEYLRKRLIGLLVPYYLLCILSLTVYVGVRATLPALSLGKVVSWLSIRPTGDITGFPMSQVWFLHTLFVISGISPAYFWLYHRKPWFLLSLMFLSIALSGIQIVTRIDNYFFLAGNNLYTPIVHSFFYILGFAYFSSSSLRSKRLLCAAVLFCLILGIGILILWRLDADYTYHTHPPDLYYVAGSLAAIGGWLISKETLLGMCKKLPLVARVLSFTYRYTFPIYLLHTFSIYLCEELFGLVEPQGHYVRYGIIKLTLVLIVTCVLSIPFGALSTSLTRLCITFCARFRLGRSRTSR